MTPIDISVQVGTGGLTFYIPAPFRCIVTKLVAVFSATVAVGDTVDIQRSSTSVNLATTTVVTAAVPIEGTRDTTNKQLIFDPASATAANKVLKVAVSALESETQVGIHIELDEFAIVTQ